MAQQAVSGFSALLRVRLPAARQMKTFKTKTARIRVFPSGKNFYRVVIRMEAGQLYESYVAADSHLDAATQVWRQHHAKKSKKDSI